MEQYDLETEPQKKKVINLNMITYPNRLLTNNTEGNPTISIKPGQSLFNTLHKTVPSIKHALRSSSEASNGKLK